jgi:2-isopropylmalate synthase
VLEALYGAAIAEGVERVCLADTTGHATPEGARRLTTFIRELIRRSGRDVKIDWHGHMDRGLGVLNSIAAWEAGADRLHGTALGVGERVGNTPIDLLLVNFRLMGVITHSLLKLTDYVNLVSRAVGIPIPINYPVFGKDAFETATGVHASAVVKALKKGDLWLANRVYSAVPADEFGRSQVISVGPMSGRSNVTWWLESRSLEATEDRVKRILEASKRSDHILTEQEIRALV